MAVEVGVKWQWQWLGVEVEVGVKCKITTSKLESQAASCKFKLGLCKLRIPNNKQDRSQYIDIAI